MKQVWWAIVLLGTAAIAKCSIERPDPSAAPMVIPPPMRVPQSQHAVHSVPSAPHGAQGSAIAHGAPPSPETPTSQGCEAVLVRSHRGNTQMAAENTPKALQAAVQTGFERVELDLRQLADGAWALHHDALIGRIVQGQGEQRLSAISAAQWKALTVRHPDGTQQAPALLHDVLPILQAPSKVHALFEIKGTPACPAVHALVQQLESALPQRVQIAALSLPVLTCVRQVSRIPVALLIAPQVTDAELERAQVARQMFSKDLERYGVSQEQSRQTLRRAYAQNGNWDLLKSNEALQGALRPLMPVTVVVDAPMLLEYAPRFEHLQRSGVGSASYSASDTSVHAQYLRAYAQRTGMWVNEWIIDGPMQSVCSVKP